MQVVGKHKVGYAFCINKTHTRKKVLVQFILWLTFAPNPGYGYEGTF